MLLQSQQTRGHRGCFRLKYLDTLVSSNESAEGKVKERIGHSSRIFGMLWKAVFQDSDPSVTSKRLVYLSVVLGMLLYGLKMWTIKSRTMHKLSTTSTCGAS